MSARLCPVCGFQQDTRSESGKCLGCGHQLDPHPDHSAPAPGFHIENGGDYAVTEQDVQRYPELGGVIVIRALEYEYGRGIGMEPYGYHTTLSKKVIDADVWMAAHEDHQVTSILRDELADERCPNCSSPLFTLRFSQDRAGVAGSRDIRCDTCDEEIDSEFWA